VISKILSHLGLPTRAPPKAPARLDAFLQTASSPNRIPLQCLEPTDPFAQCQPVHATKAPHGRLIRKKWGRQTPSQDKRPHVGPQSPGIEPSMTFLVRCDSLKKAF